MSNQPRFTLELRLHDNRGEAESLRMAIGVDDDVRISSRQVGDMKASGELGVNLVSFDETVEMMRRREFRKKLFIEQAQRLGALMAERMEDAEGWHDVSRIEPARRKLGGRW